MRGSILAGGALRARGALRGRNALTARGALGARGALRARGTLRAPMSAAVALLLVTVLLVALTGCTGIPTSGPVVAGKPITAEVDTGVDFLPTGPSVGATPREILAGFIAAATGPKDKYAVARQFLSRGFAAQWNPNAGVLVHERVPTFAENPDGSIDLVVPGVGQVDAGGRYDEFGTTVESRLPFTFVKEDGQWRISQAANGLVLQKQSFYRLFSARPLYFYDPSFAYLVPDLRWFPARSDASTRTVSALLAGPSPVLASPVLVSAFPPEATLAQSVSVKSGTAVVNLSVDGFSADPLTQQRMKLQLVTSLRSSSISATQIILNGSELQVSDFATGAPVANPRVAPSPLVGKNGQFGLLVGEEVTPLDPLAPAITTLQPRSVTVSTGQTQAVVGTASGSYRVQAGNAAPALVDSRPGLVAPALDNQGYLWSVPATDPGALLAFDGKGTAVPVAAGWANVDTVTAVAVSRDSARLLVLFTSKGVPRLRVYGIQRDQAGVPLKLSSEAQDMTVESGVPVAAAWVDDLTIATLSTSSDGTSAVTLQQIGGQSVSLGRPSGGVAIAGGNGQTGIRVLAPDGSLLAPRGNTWQPVATGIGYLAVQR